MNDINRTVLDRLADVMKDERTRASQETVTRPMELLKRLQVRGWIKRDTYNIVRPMGEKLVPTSRLIG
jgi:hypothetical protein